MLGRSLCICICIVIRIEHMRSSPFPSVRRLNTAKSTYPALSTGSSVQECPLYNHETVLWRSCSKAAGLFNILKCCTRRLRNYYTQSTPRYCGYSSMVDATSTYPPPPPYFRLYAQFGEETATCPLPPPPSSSGRYTTFGEAHNVRECAIAIPACLSL